MMPLKLSMLQPWVKARTYILHHDFGMHHNRIIVTRNSFWRVLSDLSKEFDIKLTIKKYGHGNHYFYYLKNYFGDWDLIGETIFVRNRPVDLDLEAMFS